ncbi:MAG: sensor histidine kinase [Bradyrhizobium sp.]|nr:sensor histidine kinase [Bradyrhizobium sp.]
MRSLRRRIIVVVVASVAAGFLLIAALTWRIVSDAATRDFDTRLANALGELALAVDFGEDRILSLSREPEDPAYNRPNSSWYWRIAKGGVTLARSRSLRLGELPVVPEAAPSEQPLSLTLPASGPSGEDLRLRHRVVPLRDGAITLDIVVAGPARDIGREVWLSMRWLLLGLAVVAVILSGLLIVEIGSGLGPLRVLAQDIERASRGEITRLEPSDYRELNPLTSSVNDLIEQVEIVVGRARAHAGNLAHAIKTPLSLISARNEMRGAEQDGEIGYGVATIRRQIDHHLKRARFAGKARLASDRVPVTPVIDDIVLVMERGYRDRGLSITASVDDGAVFLGEREDFEEMIGNLVENACKWARGIVVIVVCHSAESLDIYIEDDGPGLPAYERLRALERGRKLDETVAGSGIGLSVVADLVELYGGDIDLRTAEIGGLCAALRLPSIRLTPRAE